MPIQNDEQRKAMFANIGRRQGGGGRRYARRLGGGSRNPSESGPGSDIRKFGTPAPKPKKPKTPKPPKQEGYVLNGVWHPGTAPTSYAGWIQNLSNTTGAPPAISPSGGGSIAPYGSPSMQSTQLVWEDFHGNTNHVLTHAEKIALGLPVAAVLAWGAPAIFGIAELSEGTTFLSVAGTQGGALGVSASAILDVPMSINDSPSYYREPGSNIVKTRYPDLVGWIGGQIRKANKP